MSDIVKMLRQGEKEGVDGWWGTMADAADEIERLRAALKGLLDDLGDNDQDGLTIFSETMARAHAALRPLT